MTDPTELLRAERAATERQLAALDRTFEDVVESIEGVGNDDEHDPDGTTIAFERAQVIALRRQADANLGEIAAAFERVAAGTYGTCEVCDQPIPPERLDARPTTRTCVRCAR
ncbi:MAG: DNA-binding protein [Actinomycetia bacterium]|nr:DNA-binding protein [Actinomycetes bacterium]